MRQATEDWRIIAVGAESALALAALLIGAFIGEVDDFELVW